MAGRLHLESGHGDVKLKGLEFAVFGVANPADAESISLSGMSYRLGRPVFSTNLIHAYDAAVGQTGPASSAPAQQSAPGGPGRVMIIRRPASRQFGYGVFTRAYIDRQLKRVGGAPLRYAASRKQLALYGPGEVEVQRQKYELAAVEQGIFALPEERLPAESVIGWLPGDKAAMEALDNLVTAASEFSEIPIDQFARYIGGQVQSARLLADQLPAIGHSLVVGTVESVVMSRLRMMRWQALAGLGYSFYEGREPVNTIRPVDSGRQIARLEDMQRRLASSQLFEGELVWLKSYISSSVQIMLMEADATTAP